VFTVKLLEYDNESFSTRQSRTYKFIEPHTLGELVDVIIDERMDEFVFLPYDNKWKGCGDFMCVFSIFDLYVC